jgi:hypothetical protein
MAKGDELKRKYKWFAGAFAAVALALVTLKRFWRRQP